MKTNFIPNSDDACLTWHDNLLTKLVPEDGLPEASINDLKAVNADLHTKLANACAAQASSKEATSAKMSSRRTLELVTRSAVRLIKASPHYTEDKGFRLGVVGPEVIMGLNTASPDLTAEDKTGGTVVLSFTKRRSDGVNIYCQREGDSDWVILGRATASPYQDNRPLLQTGKPELRRYTAVYMKRDQEIGSFSADQVVNCAP